MEQVVRARIDELVERRGLPQADARARCAHFARDEFYAQEDLRGTGIEDRALAQATFDLRVLGGSR
jgi:hypothetical protein